VQAISAPDVNGPNGVQIADNKPPSDSGPSDLPAAPGGPQAAPTGDSTQMPSDGNVVPGRGTQAPAGPAVADPGVPEAYNAVSGPEVASVLTDAGFATQLGKDTQGNPMIDGDIGGYKYRIFFYGCTAGAGCGDLQFHAVFNNDSNVTDDKINAYNRDNRFGQAYFQQDGSIGLDMSATVRGGISPDHLKAVIAWWKTTLTQFSKKVTGG
jgi:hypothetical protein